MRSYDLYNALINDVWAWRQESSENTIDALAAKIGVRPGIVYNWLEWDESGERTRTSIPIHLLPDVCYIINRYSAINLILLATIPPDQMPQDEPSQGIAHAVTGLRAAAEYSEALIKSLNDGRIKRQENMLNQAKGAAALTHIRRGMLFSEMLSRRAQ